MTVLELDIHRKHIILTIFIFALYHQRSSDYDLVIIKLSNYLLNSIIYHVMLDYVDKIGTEKSLLIGKMFRQLL